MNHSEPPVFLQEEGNELKLCTPTTFHKGLMMIFTGEGSTENTRLTVLSYLFQSLHQHISCA